MNDELELLESVATSVAGSRIELEVKEYSATVLQMPYLYSTNVVRSGHPWRLEKGERVKIIGINGWEDELSLSKTFYWRVQSGNLTGYVKDSVHYSGSVSSSFHVFQDGVRIGHSESRPGRRRSRRDKADEQRGKVDELLTSLSSTTKIEIAELVGDREFVVFGVFPDGPNSAGGVGVKFAYRHLNSDKVIKYLNLEITPFNRVGDRVVGRISRRSTKGFRVTGPIDGRPMLEGGLYRVASFGESWYNGTISCLQLERIDIEYLDGTRSSLAGKALDDTIFPEFRNSCSF